MKPIAVQSSTLARVTCFAFVVFAFVARTGNKNFAEVLPLTEWACKPEVLESTPANYNLFRRTSRSKKNSLQGHSEKEKK